MYRWSLKYKRAYLHFVDTHSSSPKAFVLLYHRINNIASDPLALAVSPENFEAQLSTIQKNFKIISLPELVSRLQQKSLQGNEVVITFDDGYKDNLIHALPIAKKLNVPITIFVTTSILEGTSQFFWDDIYSNTKDSYLSNGDIKTLSKESLVTLGGHTISHPRLRDLNSEKQKSELVNSKNTLEAIVGEPIEYFAYPFGDYPDFNTLAVRNVKKSGYVSAFTNVQRPASLRSNLFKIPRILASNSSGEEMQQKLDYFSKNDHVTFVNILAKIGRYSRSFLISLFTEKIPEEKFSKIYQELKEIYIKNKAYFNYAKYVMPKWQSNTDAIEEYFLSSFSIEFLRNKIIQNTMFMYTFSFWKNIQKILISGHMDRLKAKEILREYNIGKPLLNDWQNKSSGNNIHHLYHLLKFFKESSTNATVMNTVVEVGGGYGNMAKIFKKINPNATYVIIDIPIFSYIQALYLKTIFGREAVVLFSENRSVIERGKVNIVPLNDDTIRSVKDMLQDTDLFISTWALSESNQEMQNLIKELKYFNAKYLLLAYQKSDSDFGFAENIKDVQPDYSPFFNAETDYAKDNFYLFARRSL